MSLRSLNIAPRALLGFALIGVLMLSLGVFSLMQMSDIREAGVKIETVGVPSIKTLNELTLANQRLRTLGYNLLVNRDPQVLSETAQRMDERNAQIDKARQAYQSLVEAQNEQVIFDHYGQLLGEYRQFEARIRDFSRDGRLEDLRALLNGDMLRNSDAINTVMGELVQFNTDQSRKSNAAAQNSYEAAIQWVIGVLVIATLLTFLFAFSADPQHRQASRRCPAHRRVDRRRGPHPCHRHLRHRRGRAPVASHGEDAERPARHGAADCRLCHAAGLGGRGAEQRHR